MILIDLFRQSASNNAEISEQTSQRPAAGVPGAPGPNPARKRKKIFFAFIERRSPAATGHGRQNRATGY